MLGLTDFGKEKEVPFIEFGHGSVVLGAISNYGVVNMIGFYPPSKRERSENNTPTLQRDSRQTADVQRLSSRLLTQKV